MRSAARKVVLGAAFAAGVCDALLVVPRGWKNPYQRLQLRADGGEGSEGGECDFALDALQLIDSSYSVFNTIGAAQEDLSAVVNLIRENLTDSRIATATFTDKPIPPLGYNESSYRDRCFVLQTDFEHSFDEQIHALQNVYVAGGWDFPEAQLEAMLRGALAPQVKWRTEQHNAEGLPIVKTVILSTDSIAHRAPNATSALNALGLPDAAVNELTSEDLASTPNARCGTVEYPTFEYLKKVFNQERVIPIFLVAPAQFPCNSASGFCVFPELLELAKWTGNNDYRDAVKGMFAFYTDVATRLGRPVIIESLGNGFDGFLEKLQDALEQLQWLVCEEGILTTPSASTESETTTKPATELTNPPAGISSSGDAPPASTQAPAESSPGPDGDECVCPDSPCCAPKIKIVVDVQIGCSEEDTAAGRCAGEAAPAAAVRRAAPQILRVGGDN